MTLKQQLTPEPVVSALMGHAEKGETYGRYGKRIRLNTVYDKGVLKLNFEGLDLSHLKTSKYVPD